MEGYIGTVLPMAITYAPRNFSDCKGQLLSIQQYAALYALIGIAYGGDARTTFALPNLQGRFPLGIGTTPNTFLLGATGGSSSATLNISNIPPHTHPASASVAMSGMSVTLPPFNASAATTTTLKASSTGGAVANPGNGSYLAGITGDTGGGDTLNGKLYVTAAPASTVTLGGVNSTTNVTVTPAGTAGVSGSAATSVTVGPTGAGAPFSSMPPYTALRFVICINGLFPARN